MNPHRKFVVGVTGGIGSGKSAACAVFEELGITVVDADQAARVVVEPGTEGLKKIAEHFGNDVIQADGTMDRAAMRRLVFENPAERKWLESLLPGVAPSAGGQTEHTGRPRPGDRRQ